jgi:ParB-like chromosome segregation protein Spo0J
MPDDELRDLADDIKKNGLNYGILVCQGMVLDGRNRLRACKLAGVQPKFDPIDFRYAADPDQAALDFVLSCNLHRRHLTPAQRRQVIAAVLKQDPKRSDRRVAEQTKTSDKTVAAVRTELEGRAEIPHVEAREDSRGRAQPSRRRYRRRQPVVRSDQGTGEGNGHQRSKPPRVIDTEEAAEADARHQWLKKFAEALDWFERFVGQRNDEYLAWYTKPDSPGFFDHGITAERIEAVKAQLDRAAAISFRRRGERNPEDGPADRPLLA